MTNRQPITPPPELVKQWSSNFYGTTVAPGEAAIDIATQAARWGADQELEACVELLKADGYKGHAIALRNVRRPKPPSLKEQALAALENDDIDVYLIRRALEALPND